MSAGAHAVATAGEPNMRAIHLFAPMLSICCAGATLAQTFETKHHKYLYVEPCRANVQSVFKDGMGQVFVVSVGLSIRNAGTRPIDGVTVDLLDRFDNVLSAKSRQLAVKPGEARADTTEIFGLIISADETKSPAYAGTTRIVEDLERQYAVASCGIVGFQFAANEAATPAPGPAALGLRVDPDGRTAPTKLKVSRSDRSRQ
jgi:hypothetical protein